VDEDVDERDDSDMLEYNVEREGMGWRCIADMKYEMATL